MNNHTYTIEIKIENLPQDRRETIDEMLKELYDFTQVIGDIIYTETWEND